MSQLKPGVKKGIRFLVVLLIGVGIYFGVTKTGILDGILKESVAVAAVDLPDAPKTSTGENTAFAGLPSSNETTKSLPAVRMANMAWNSQLGLHFANGGPVTTEGSLMEKHGVKLTIVRQDDIIQASQDLVKFAEEYSKNPSTASGIQMFAMMGDGTPAILAAMNKELKKIGNGEYIAQVFYSNGASVGEDAFMAPLDWKVDPQKAKGGVVSTVILDGDWNIVVNWASNNTDKVTGKSIKINTDEKTYDPDAINFIAAKDNVDAAEKYVTGYKEKRKVIKDGKTTGETIEIQANAVSVWTPSDVTVAEKKGGLVRLVSTKEYSSQMPNAVIGIKKWLEDNKTTVVNMILAATDGGDQVKTYSKSLDRAGEISAKIYDEKDGAYWVKYAKGVTQTDATGLSVELGGSTQFNLADNLNLFGIAEGSTNTFGIVYKTFGNIAKSLYPERFPEFQEVGDILNLTFLREAKTKAGSNITAAAEQKYATGNVSQVVSEKTYVIEFATGSANLTTSGRETLNDIYEAAVVANGLKVQVEGHTDNTGSEDINKALSEARANAVVAYLKAQSSTTFPASRTSAIGYGSSQPVADNSTNFGRAKNRRVVIKMGK